ncbi:MAG: peptidase, partial [Planctomycetales bacterium]|nr:peptidase [Planctomycetales bacterium]NIP70557.1 peptidase [Planctomycetales bacterium]
LAGVTFTLTGVDGMGNQVVPIEMSSDETGLLWFTDLVPGTYTLTETIPPGYMTS